ncbi:MAG: hypothetical protein H3C51_04110 [Rubellimicrobium sp.]|nr:hypothetical protein [Rubellimicrobium sp.]
MNMTRSLSAVALAIGMTCGPALLAAEGTDAPLFFEGDMVSETAGCVLANQFAHGDVVVFRVRVLDATGAQLGDDDLASLTVSLPDGQSFDMHYGGHPPGDDLDFYWTVTWMIPDDYPTGTLGYHVTATGKDGATHDWAPFHMPPSTLTIIPG